MAAIEWDDVVLLASELAALSEDSQDEILDYVNSSEALTGWGADESSKKLRKGRIYLAAHMGTLALPASAGGLGPNRGLLLEVQEGDARVRFASVGDMAGTTSLQLTMYGREFDRLGKTTAPGLGLVNGL